MNISRLLAKQPVVFLVAAYVAFLAPAARADQGKTIRSFYFGNSLTAGTAPEFHDELARSCGDTWEAEMFGIGGGRLQQYVDLLFPQYADMAYPVAGGDRSRMSSATTRTRT